MLAGAALGDLDGNGNADLAVGADGDKDGGNPSGGEGAVWILFLNSDGTVKSKQKISKTAGGWLMAQLRNTPTPTRSVIVATAIVP